MSEKAETGEATIKIVTNKEVHALGKNAVPVEVVPENEAPAGGTKIKTVFMPSKAVE